MRDDILDFIVMVVFPVILIGIVVWLVQIPTPTPTPIPESEQLIVSN